MTSLMKWSGVGTMLVLVAGWVSDQSHPSHEITNGEITATIYLPDANRTVVAPEPYIDLNIEPGQQFTWTYTYDYSTTK